MRRAAVLPACLLLAAACAAPGPTSRLSSARVVATPVPTPDPTPPPTPVPVPPATPRLTRPPAPPKPRPARPVPAAPSGDLAAFRGLGGWIDVFDHGDDPSSVLPAVREMAAQGAKTLYLETARYNSPGDVLYPRAFGAALDEAHRLGMRVVGWYPPDFADVARDLQRSLGAIRFVSPGGGRLDAFAPDIEYPSGVPDAAERSARAVSYSRALREAVGGFPLAAIVIPPTSLEINPGRWRDFPWAALAPLYDVFMPMSYWTARRADPDTARSLTDQNVRKTAQLTGRPVHVIGGLGDKADEAQVSAYVSAARAAGALGGGLYDHAITRPEVWDELRGLNA